MGEQVPNWLKKRALLTPEKTAVVFSDKPYSFLELYNSSLEIAGQLSSLKVTKGQYTAVLLRNHVDSVMVLHALQMLGVKAVIINNRLTAEEAAWQLKNSRASLLITEESFSKVVAELKLVLETNIITKEELFKLTSVPPSILEEYPLDEATTIMYTSGTTGTPKGVIQTYGNHWWSAIGSALNLGLSESDKWLCTLPIFHISGYSILMRSVIYGIPMILHEGFEEAKILAEIKTYKVSIMSAVSTMVSRILEELKEDGLPSSFRCILLGGGPASLSLLEKCKEKGIPVFQTYGMTETASQTATLSPEYATRKLGSSGKPLFPVSMKIVDSVGREVGSREVGEIIVKGPNVSIGYLYNEKATSETLFGGWLHTGDIGYFDEDGFLFVLDRRSDLIISGGENIYPAELEGVLLEHPDVVDAGIVGVSDDVWGQIPIGFVVIKQNANLKEDELKQFCLKKLAKYKIPRSIYFMDELPRNASKKLLRRKLREWLNAQGI